LPSAPSPLPGQTRRSHLTRPMRDRARLRGS
jgi:hypothetical protein